MVPKVPPVVTVWDGISKLGLTFVVFVNVSIFTIKYCEIWRRGVEFKYCDIQSAVRSAIGHCETIRAAYTWDWFTQNHVTVIKWPSDSSDLIPVENA